MTYKTLLSEAREVFGARWRWFVSIGAVNEAVDWATESGRSALTHRIVWFYSADPISDSVFTKMAPHSKPGVLFLFFAVRAGAHLLAFLALFTAFLTIAAMIAQNRGPLKSIQIAAKNKSVYGELFRLGLFYLIGVWVAVLLATWSVYFLNHQKWSSSYFSWTVGFLCTTPLLLFLSRYSWNIPLLAVDPDGPDRVVTLSRSIKRQRAALYVACVFFYEFWSLGVGRFVSFAEAGFHQGISPDQIAARHYLLCGVAVLLRGIPLAFCMVLLSLACFRALDESLVNQSEGLPSSI